MNDGGSLLAFSVGAKGQAKDILALPPSYELGSSGSPSSLNLPGSVTVNFASPPTSNLSEGVGVETVTAEGSAGSTLPSVKSPLPRPLFANLADRPNVRVLGRFGDGEVAGVSLSFGHLASGRAVLWAPSLDLPLATVPSPDPEEEKRRFGFIEESLRGCGLELPNAGAVSARVPTPMYFVGAAPIVDTILSRLSVDFTQEQTKELKDQNDTFIVHPPSDTVDLPEPDATTLQPKRIVALTNNILPPKERTPTFDVRLYLDELAKGKQRSRDINDYSDPWPIGAALMYGEVVTSTQTMLDRNPRFLANLPNPLLCLAAYQLQGRGRGTNMWLSPYGCLQFSLALRIPSAKVPMNKLVFLQYLFSLAIAEACRDEAVLGRYGEAVKIKWPNDIYVALGEGKDRQLRKIGGVLVNTGIINEDSQIVIVGCGLNALCPPPMCSLLQLIPPEASLELRMEKVAAMIMIKLEPLLDQWIKDGGSFESLTDLYLKRWLHSNEIVEVTTVTPPQRVKIVGITPDFGLLRTLPISQSGPGNQVGWGYGGYGGFRQSNPFLDLQPDGNSFDIMAGLIKSKST